MSTQMLHRIRAYCSFAAVAALVITPLLALAYFATTAGAQSLDTPTVAAWAVPAQAVLGGLIGFADPDVVYAIYNTVMALLFPAVFLTALAARSLRPRPLTRIERVAWWVTLVGYGTFGTGAVLVASSALAGATDLTDVAFMILMAPGMLLMMVGSTMLGVVLLRHNHQPRATSWLLTLSLPILLAISVGLGHNGLGIAPLFVAWALTARHWPSNSDSIETAEASRMPVGL